jgi:hypothetical protein
LRSLALVFWLVFPRFKRSDQSNFTIGARGSAAIYTGGEYGGMGVLRKISIRAHSWFNWLYPINF